MLPRLRFPGGYASCADGGSAGTLRLKGIIIVKQCTGPVHGLALIGLDLAVQLLGQRLPVPIDAPPEADPHPPL